jgi:head-tail adaptor
MFDRQIKKTSATVMRHYVEIQSATRASDAEGGVSNTWATSSYTFASIDPIQARQQYLYNSVNVDATHLIKMRGGVTIDEKNRIKWNIRIFEILTIEDINEMGIIKVITTKEAR